VDPTLRRFRTYVEDLSSGRQTELGPTDTRVFFCPDQPGASLGDLLYCKNGTLLAQRFDSGRLSAAGEPVPIADHVPYFRPTAWSEFTVSQDGTVVFSTGFPKTQLTWLDRSGRELGTVWQPQPFWGDLRISPDGLKVAAGISDIATGGSDIWIYDLTTGTGERLTFEPGVEAMSVWSRDGKRVSYGNAQAAAPQLRMKAASGRGTEEAFAPGPFQLPFDWSSDGRWIFYQTSGNDVDAEIWVASPASRKVLPLVQGPFDHSQPCLSPDGRYLAFIANETGRDEIYVQRFEDGEPPRLSGERTRVSQNGGYMPRWCSGGKELVFLSPQREVMAAECRLGTVEFGSPVRLFQLPASFRAMAPPVAAFDVAPDGRKFLALVGKSADPLHIIVNWRAALKG
jgi:dipeptidyl aminopeptidase/acylaminoacyl peptidase